MADNQNLFDQAVAAAKQKDFATARTVLKQLLKQEPNNVDAWLLGAYVVESRPDAIRCYERALQIDPNNAYAKQKLSELQALPPEPATAKPPVQPAAPQPKAAQAKTGNHPPTAPAGPPEVKPKSSTWVFVLAGVLIVALCLAVTGIGILSSGGLSSLGSSQPTPTDQQLFEVLHTNAKAGNNEDIEAYMATVHPDSPMYDQTEEVLKDMFAQFDLDFQFYDLTVTSLKSNEAKVHFSLITRKLAGPDFRNNIVIGTMILRPDNGIWKIYNQEVEDVQY
jgi:tetratricopeptide (TPR) repeat protein